MSQIRFDNFHDDLCAAIMAGVPLQTNESEILSLNKVANLKAAFDESDLSNLATAEFQSQILEATEFPKWYRVALSTFAQTGTMLPVLEALSVRPLAVTEVRRALKWTIIYLGFVLAAACAGLVIYHLYVSPAIVEFRNDHTRLPAVELNQNFDLLPLIPWIAGALAVALTIYFVWVCCGGLLKTAMWLGGSHFVRCRASTTALRISQALVESGAPVDSVVETSCDLVGIAEKDRGDVRSAICSTEEMTDDVSYLSQVAEYLKLTGAKRLAYLRVATPVLLVAVAGGLVSVIYGVVLFWPIFSLIHDLPSAGI